MPYNRIGRRIGSLMRIKPRLKPQQNNAGGFKPYICIALITALAVLFAFSAVMLILYYAEGAQEEYAFQQLAAMAGHSVQAQATEAKHDAAPEAPQAAPAAQEKAILPQYKRLYELNPDLAGWIKIDGTGINYPVMHTSDDFYLSHGFDKQKAKSGVPYIDKRCKAQPLGTNTIIYGHHMNNGTMFTALENYKNEDFYKAHPAIRFDTLYERQEYEIIAVFKSRTYQKSDTAFKHYDFLSAESKADFDEYISNIKSLSLYDTCRTAEYGDQLLTLVSCAYHTKNGQFVVVAKKTESTD